jgi:hypothetical protein
MKITVEKVGPVYTAVAVGVVNASPARVLKMLTTPEGALGFELVEKVLLWKEEGSVVHVRYKMATTPSFDVDVVVQQEGSNKVSFSSVDDTWVDMKGSWEIKPCLFGHHRTHIVLKNTITVNFFLLRLLPLHGIIRSTVETLFENFKEHAIPGLWKRLLKKWCCCCSTSVHGELEDRPPVPVEQQEEDGQDPLHGPISADETSGTG